MQALLSRQRLRESAADGFEADAGPLDEVREFEQILLEYLVPCA